jgi:hypothetical protein
MNSDIGATIKERCLEFFDKKSFATHLVEWLLQQLIATRCHPQQADLKRGILSLKPGLYMLCLPQCEWALARSNNNRV